MSLLPMIRGGAIAMAIATATLVQGCNFSGTAPPPQQALLTDSGPTTGPYSGAPWYADRYYYMTTESGGE